MPGRGAAEHGPHQLRVIGLQHAHGVAGGTPQAQQVAGLGITLEQGLVGGQGLFDLGVGRQVLARRQAQLLRRLALGLHEVVDAVLGDQPGCTLGQFQAQFLRGPVVCGHGAQNNWSVLSCWSGLSTKGLCPWSCSMDLGA